MIRYVDCNATHPGDGSKAAPSAPSARQPLWRRPVTRCW